MAIKRGLLALLLLVTAALPVSAQYPNRSIRLIIPFPPGGSTGYAAKVLADELQKVLGQPVTLDVKTGNFGINALSELVGQSDAYTLMVGSVITNSMTPVMHRQDIKFDYDKEVMPVTRLADFPSVVMIAPAASATTLKDFLASLKHSFRILRAF